MDSDRVASGHGHDPTAERVGGGNAVAGAVASDALRSHRAAAAADVFSLSGTRVTLHIWAN